MSQPRPSRPSPYIKSVPNEEPPVNIDISTNSDALMELKQILKSRAFLSQVACMSSCSFARFTGVIFERCAISEFCPDGIPEEMRNYALDVNFAIVHIPPGIIARALSRGASSSTVAEEMFASYLSRAETTLSAVYERHGVDEDDLINEQHNVDWQETDLGAQMEAWGDIAKSSRLETDIFSTKSISLFEETRSIVD